MPIIDEMIENLQENLKPQHLEIVDDSESHRGHAGYKEGGESHFHVIIQSNKLLKLTRIEKHRAIHNALGKSVMARIHALAITILG